MQPRTHYTPARVSGTLVFPRCSPRSYIYCGAVTPSLSLAVWLQEAGLAHDCIPEPGLVQPGQPTPLALSHRPLHPKHAQQLSHTWHTHPCRDWSAEALAQLCTTP